MKNLDFLSRCQHGKMCAVIWSSLNYPDRLILCGWLLTYLKDISHCRTWHNEARLHDSSYPVHRQIQGYQKHIPLRQSWLNAGSDQQVSWITRRNKTLQTVWCMIYELCWFFKSILCEIWWQQGTCHAERNIIILLRETYIFQKSASISGGLIRLLLIIYVQVIIEYLSGQKLPTYSSFWSDD